MSDIRVILAEDHTIVREATAEILNHQPDIHVVGQVGTGDEAITLARELQADVAVMDIAMPRLNGIEATRRIAAECPRCKVLALTAHSEERYIIQLLQAGAMGFLPKTVRLDELVEAIRAVARGESVLPPGVANIVVRYLSSNGVADKTMPSLTDRELEVLQLAAQGLTNYNIARELHISVRTVEAHLTNTYDKLKVNSRTEAVVHAMQQGWV